MARRGTGTTPEGAWGDWLLPPAAWARALAAWGPAMLPDEEVPLPGAHERILAADLYAPFDSPAFDRSALDGYAVRASDVATASSAAPVSLTMCGEVTMGTQATLAVSAGEAAWVATGAMLPQGADSVVMVERTERDGERVLIGAAAAVGDGVIRRGDDVQAGALVLRAGHRLRPQDIAALASLGQARVAVRRRPRVAVVAGGDELVTPGESLGPGQIYDANSYALAAQVDAWGGEAVIYPRTPDRPEAVRAALEAASAESAIVLLSGGSSVGLKDLTAEAIDAFAPPGVVIHGVAMRPGRPTMIGVVQGALVVGIPGNPVSAMIACEVFVRPALETLLGQQPQRTAGTVGGVVVAGTLVTRVPSQVGRQDYVRVALEHEGATTLVRTVRGGSNAIHSMVAADGLLVVPPERAAYEAGEVVEVALF